MTVRTFSSRNLELDVTVVKVMPQLCMCVYIYIILYAVILYMYICTILHWLSKIGKIKVDRTSIKAILGLCNFELVTSHNIIAHGVFR